MATPAGRAAAVLARLESLTPDRRFVLGAVSGAVLCDYGESVGRALAPVFVGFAVLYGVTHSVVRVGPGPGGVESPLTTTDPSDLAIFSLLALTTSGSPVVTLQPRDPSPIS